MAKKRLKRAAWALAIVPCLVLVTACMGQSGGSDDVRSQQPPDAVGVVTSVVKRSTSVAVGFAPDEGYEYFDGTTFELATTGGLEDPDGLAADPNNLAVGDHLEVWVDSCAESMPVQCSDPVARVAADADSS